MLAKATGLTFFRALSFSLFVYTGAGQMAAVTMLAQNVAYVIIIFTVFINKLYMSLTIFLYIKILVSEQGNTVCEKLSNCHKLLIMRNDKKDYRNSQHFAFAF